MNKEPHIPTFAERLASQPTLGGWRNPLAPADSTEGKATATAERWIQKMQTWLEDHGYQPFTGTEINFYPGESALAHKYLQHVIEETRLARIEAGFRMLHNERCLKGWPKPIYAKALPEEEKDGAQRFEQLLDAALQKETFSYNCMDYRELQSYAKWFTTYLTPQMNKALGDFFRDPLQVNKPGIIALNSGESENEFIGKSHLDNMNLEFALTPADPMTTIRRTRRLKLLAFQGGWDYDAMYLCSKEEIANPASYAPVEPAIEKLIEHIGDHGIAFSDPAKGSTGEHLNISLVKTTPGTRESYIHLAQGEKGKEHFLEHNLMTRLMNRSIFDCAYKMYLGHDTLLALGNPRDLDRFCRDESGGKGHDIRPDKATTQEGGRIEIRSFNMAASNLSLSMLAVMAITVATVKTIQELGLEEKFREGWIDKGDITSVMKRMSEKWPPKMEVSDYVEHNITRFTDNSLTLAMMRDMIEEKVSQNDETISLIERMQEVDEFRDTIIKRTRDMYKERGAGSEFTPHQQVTKARLADTAITSGTVTTPSR